MKPRKSPSSAVGLTIFKKLNERTFQTLQMGVIQPLWGKMLLNQEKFTGSEIPHLRTSPQDKLVYKCTKRMLRDTACNKRDWGRPPWAAATERLQMVEYSKSNRKTLRTQINLPDMLLNENSKFQNKTAVLRHHLFKTCTGNHSVQLLSRSPTHT